LEIGGIMDHSTAIKTKIDSSIVLEIGTINMQGLPNLFKKATGHFVGDEPEKHFIQTRKSARLDVDDYSFDYCFTENTIYFWEEPIAHLKEIYRALKNAGMFSMAFIEKQYGGDLPWTQLDFTFYDPNEVKFFFKQAGFVGIEEKQMRIENRSLNGKIIEQPVTLISGYK
jgi:SAM-dependent methyltransferase